ncbi:CRP/FNR family transcriptional regulator, anaerobic regulatory protein [Methylobacterium sp. UNC300MFChir4.1]|uniref:helix-turn-helix domain-containing protein n=1 Tax=Methylobacterium sp. UNC300MFChir4.1 TaxID=1502747 RepID=UPI0008D0BCDE|nr:helix-turn-helix domain-containing protein [Methylobacterium sp. UNC300MFChir4.1]SEN94341.1 CRP/FNR family transcriptional regulator, anaerobic regulatory protein [Methylobacterium sp. UNC300MFChir4.1]
MSTEFTARTAPEGPAARPAPVPEIEGSTLFAGCPDVVGTPFSYAREEEIYGEGEEAEFVYKVVSGAVRTHRVLSDGRRQITGFHLPGDLFGLGQGEINRQTAEALTSTKVLIFKRRQVERAATGRAEVACRLWSMATSDLRHAQDLALLLGRRSAQERVAAFLLEVDDRLGAAGTFALPMTRRDIADYLGLTIETVSRTLSQLEEDGALRRDGGRQVCLHRTRLRRLVED